MRYRPLGKTGVQVSEIGLGCLEFGDRVPEADALKVVHAALDSGVNLFDTAIGYARGRSAEVLGKALKGRRHQAIIATKVRAPIGPGPNDAGLSRAYLMRAIDVSLRQLETDHVDLLQVHFPDYETPMEETLAAFEDLRRAGKVLYYGSSNFPAWYLCDAQWRARQHGYAGFATTQIKYNVMARDVEQELFPLCAQEGMGIIVYNPLAGSFLAGIYHQDREPDPATRFGHVGVSDLRAIYKKRYWSEGSFRAVERLRELWRGSGKTLAQHSLGWVLSNQQVSSALVGTANVRELEEDLAAADVMPTPEERRVCDDVWMALWPVRPYYVIL